jgi:hypothetical protein
MEQFFRIIRKKPLLYLLVSVSFIVVSAFCKWTIHPTWMTLFFVLGGIMGIYFLDVAEAFIHIDPSPFKSIVFFGALGVVMLFIVTSSGSAFTSGLVLTVYLTLLVRFGHEYMPGGDPNAWFTQLADPISLTAKKIILGVCITVFVLASV